MTSLEELRVCSWDTASDCGSAHSRMLAEAQQHGGALIETCQRLEAMNFGPCGHPTCQSRVGESAFAYLCALAAGIESVVLGETEIVGQLRLAGRHASPALENVITRAVAVGRTFRRRHDLAADAGQLFDLGIAATGIKKPRSVLIAGSGPTTRRRKRLIRNGRVAHKAGLGRCCSHHMDITGPCALRFVRRRVCGAGRRCANPPP